MTRLRAIARRESRRFRKRWRETGNRASVDEIAEYTAARVVLESCRVLCSSYESHPRQTKCPANILRWHFGVDSKLRPQTLARVVRLKGET